MALGDAGELCDALEAGAGELELHAAATVATEIKRTQALLNAPLFPSKEPNQYAASSSVGGFWRKPPSSAEALGSHLGELETKGSMAGGAYLSEGPVTIHGGLFVLAGATLVLGSQENPVPTGTISGGVHATHPLNLQIHFTTINGGVVSHGGSGPFGGPFDVSWTTIEDSTIHGTVTISGYNGFWMGFIRNHVYGSVNLSGNVLVDPDGNEYVTNSIHGNLNCSDNSPAPQIGDSEGSPNDVTGLKTGQCVNL